MNCTRKPEARKAAAATHKSGVTSGSRAPAISQVNTAYPSIQSAEIGKGEKSFRPAGILATLTAFTAHSIADQYRRFLPGRPDEVVVGGGGSRNPVLMQLLSELLDPAQIRLHEEFGLPSLGREAVYFALMGYEALHGRPNTVPSCTGATGTTPATSSTRRCGS